MTEEKQEGRVWKLAEAAWAPKGRLIAFTEQDVIFRPCTRVIELSAYEAKTKECEELHKVGLSHEGTIANLKAQVEELKREVQRLGDLNDENGMRADSWRSEYLTANRDCIHIRACLKEVVDSYDQVISATNKEMFLRKSKSYKEATEKAKLFLEGK